MVLVTIKKVPDSQVQRGEVATSRFKAMLFHRNYQIDETSVNQSCPRLSYIIRMIAEL